MIVGDTAIRLSSWEEVFDSFSRYGHCDDGYISEGYGDTVVRLLEKDWNSVSCLSELTEKSSAFREFVLRHTDEIMSPDQAEIIERNARDRCPTDSRKICAAISSHLEEIARSASSQ